MLVLLVPRFKVMIFVSVSTSVSKIKSFLVICNFYQSHRIFAWSRFECARSLQIRREQPPSNCLLAFWTTESWPLTAANGANILVYFARMKLVELYVCMHVCMYAFVGFMALVTAVVSRVIFQDSLPSVSVRKVHVIFSTAGSKIEKESLVIRHLKPPRREEASRKPRAVG